jgi:lysophospholipase L1-like esterase
MRLATAAPMLEPGVGLGDRQERRRPARGRIMDLSARRLVGAALVAITPAGLLAGSSSLASAASGAPARPTALSGGPRLSGPAGPAGPAPSAESAATTPSAGGSPMSVCHGNGSGCTKAGTYPGLNAVINRDDEGFSVVWTASVVQPYSSGVPLSWIADVTYTNVTSGTLDLTCPGDWPDASYVSEWMSGGSGDDGGVAASTTACSQDPDLDVAIQPGGTYLSTATFENVPWPGSAVSLHWGDVGSSAAVNPFRAAPVATCVFTDQAHCQSLDPVVSIDLYAAAGVSSCVSEWEVDWGDGTVTPAIILSDLPEGDVLLADHTYERRGTFTITATGTVVSGDCTATGGTQRFTLLAYAALGDSYSAGMGAGDYLPGNSASSGSCARSYNAYSQLTDARLGDNPRDANANAQFEFAACSGATTADFEQSQSVGRKSVPPQLNVLRQGTGDVGLVTFTIGGNDADFFNIVRYCAFAHFTKLLPSCQAALGKTVAKDLANLSTDLLALFVDITKTPGLAPGANVAVVGYPYPFDPALLAKKSTPVCHTGVLSNTFERSDMIWINQVVKQLDKELSNAAGALGFTYVNELTAFSGHYLCEKTPYLHDGVTSAPYTSFHPTSAGQLVLAARVEKALGLG